MAKSFSITDAMTANEVVANNADLANHILNNFSVPTRIRVYAVASAAGIRINNFQIGSEIHTKDLDLQVKTTISYRDDLIAEGVALPGQRMGLAYQNTGAGTPSLLSTFVLEELA
jgi:uncharacterized protein with PhoU and TrkA domain